MVLGAGVGRESIALAQRGLGVIGLDINHDALRLAARTALSKSVNVAFVQASFLALPIIPRQMDYLFLSGIMYSSVPGHQARHPPRYNRAASRVAFRMESSGQPARVFGS